MAIESIDRRLVNPKLYDVSVHEVGGSVVNFRWNETTGMAGLKIAYNRAKALPEVDQEIEDWKVQAIAELNK